MKVNFYLPGLRKNFPINVTFIRLLKEHPEFFREGVEIGACYGEFPPSLWNGGRVSRPDMCDEKFINMCINTINGLGVPLRYTYTNMVLEEKDLSDPYCNYCLKAAYNDMNGVILVSPILEEYVRKHFPKMKIISSTCKGIRGIDGVNNELAKGYDMVVLDYNLNNQYEELEKITDKGRCEILVNAFCAPNCPARAAHYKYISESQKMLVNNLRLPEDQRVLVKPWQFNGCKSGHNFYSILDFCTYVSPEDIWGKYVPMGFHNFKLEGRTDNIFSIIEMYCHYMVKPEFQGKVRFILIENMQRLKIIQVNQPY